MSIGKFNASAAERWMHCGGSVVVDTSHLPVEDKPYADRGQLLHAISEDYLRKGCSSKDGATLADLDQVEAYVDFVNDLPGTKFYELQAITRHGQRVISDAVVVSPDGTELEIIDAKFGSWRVSPFENWQLLTYAHAMLQVLRPLYDIERVRLTIAQPPCENFTSWPYRDLPAMPVSELEEWQAKLDARIADIQDGDAEFDPDPDNACKFCRAKPICPALAEYGKAAAKAEFADVLWEDEAGPPEVLQAVAVLDRDVLDWTWRDKLEIAQRAIAWGKAIEGEVQGLLLEDPAAVSGYKVVEGRGTRDWSDERGEDNAAEFVKSEGFTEADCYEEPKPPKFKSPAQMEKLFKGRGSGELKKGLKEFQVKAPGKPVVVPEEDPRPAIDRLAVAKAEFAEPPEEP